MNPIANMSQEQQIRGNKYPRYLSFLPHLNLFRAKREMTEDERNLTYKHPEGIPEY